MLRPRKEQAKGVTTLMEDLETTGMIMTMIVRAKAEGTDITGSLLDCIYHFWEHLVVAALQMERFNMGMHCA